VSQEECLDYIETITGWKTTKQIMQTLELSYGSVIHALRCLFKQGYLDRKQDPLSSQGYVWRFLP